ncbi:MAG: DUF3107 domain-containing protein [Actinomycetaceae bacterium]|nr:DUF3107 domain-containing protein [Actinomycetaceae bacterium]
MIIQIGISGVSRELAFEVEMSEEELFAKVEEALNNGKSLSLTDSNNRRVMIPSDKLGYVLVAESKRIPVGFTVG